MVAIVDYFNFPKNQIYHTIWRRTSKNTVNSNHFNVYFIVNTGFEHLYCLYSSIARTHSVRVRYVCFPSKFSRLVLYSCRSSVWSRVTDVSSWIVTKCAQPTETNRLIIARSANFCNGNFKLGCNRGDAFFLIFFSIWKQEFVQIEELTCVWLANLKLTGSVVMTYTFKPHKMYWSNGQKFHTISCYFIGDHWISKNVVSLFQGKLPFKGPQCTNQQENRWVLYTAAVISSGRI